MTHDLESAGRANVEDHHMLQWPSEAARFREFMARHGVRSYLEVGVGHGRFVVHLLNELPLERVYACDIQRPKIFDRYPQISFFHGDHHSPEYLDWRAGLGHLDMVFIDANHEVGFKKDYEVELQFPSTFIAFHDIANKAYPELSAFWRDEVGGRKWEFTNESETDGFGIPPIVYPYGPWRSQEDYESIYGRSCGIGISMRGGGPL